MTGVGPLLCPILVGRDDLLELADRRIAEVAAGRGHALFLSGAAGLGKTRMIRTVVRKARSLGFRVDGGSVAPQDHQVPLASIRDFANGLRGNPEWGSMAEDLLAIDGAHDGDALGSRRLVVHGVADRILEAIDRPTLLVFEDLHWTDELSLEVIGELARRVAEQPLLLVGGYRPDEFPADGTIHREWRARLVGQRLVEEVRLRPLTLDETGIATTLLLARDLPAPRDVVEAVHERTNGIPLHIEELLGALRGDGELDGPRIRSAHVPDTIGAAVLARVGRLSADARAVARAGAVVGRCFSPDVIAGVVGRPLEDLEPALEELVDAAILQPFDYVDEGYYDFRHQLLRDAIYDALPPAQRRRLHAMAADLGMGLQGASVIHASRHFERAGLRRQAFEAALVGARAASRVSARREAFELYGRAVRNMPDDLPPGERGELYEGYSDAAAAVDDNRLAEEMARQAREQYLAAGRPSAAAGLLLSMGAAARREARPIPERQALIEQMLAEIAALPATPERDALRSMGLGLKAACHIDAVELDAAKAIGREAVDAAFASGDRDLVVDAEAWLAMVTALHEDPAAGLAELLGRAREARDSGFEATGVTAFRNAALVAMRVFDYDTAERGLEEGLRYADAIEQSHCRHIMRAVSGLTDWARGRWDDALASAQQELADGGCHRGTIMALDAVGLVALGRGDLDAAGLALGRSLQAGRTSGEPERILPALWGLAEVELLARRPTASMALCDEALALATAVGERALLVPFVVTGVRAALAASRPEDAARWRVRAEAALAGWTAGATPALHHAAGLLRLATGSTVAAREALEAATAGWEAIGRTWETTWARLDLAQALLRASHVAEATGHITAARGQAEAMASRPLLDRADDLARQARGRAVTDEPWRPLTTREFEVARCIAAGLTNGEIAAQLDIAPKTASAHVEHILAKLGVARRAEIASWATSVVGRPETGPIVDTAVFPTPR
ncbi:MAG TPA: AAA family ATPase [Candidatus Limnocylindrales bacterium]|nr:AAA family ATPase [Candidatus Limnocylindrales bacterium]